MTRVVVDLYGWSGEFLAREILDANPQGRFSNPMWDPHRVREWKIVEVATE